MRNRKNTVETYVSSQQNILQADWVGGVASKYILMVDGSGNITTEPASSIQNSILEINNRINILATNLNQSNTETSTSLQSLRKEINDNYASFVRYKDVDEGARAGRYLEQAKGEINTFKNKFSQCGTRSKKDEWQRKCPLFNKQQCDQHTDRNPHKDDQCKWNSDTLFTYGHHR
jgi:hypothetical protein